MSIKQNIIGLKELRENMEKFVSSVKQGRSYTVVRRSKPIFRISPVDEWGDEGEWETVLNFTEIQKNGVPIDEVLKSLKK